MRDHSCPHGSVRTRVPSPDAATTYDVKTPQRGLAATVTKESECVCASSGLIWPGWKPWETAMRWKNAQMPSLQGPALLGHIAQLLCVPAPSSGQLGSALSLPHSKAARQLHLEGRGSLGRVSGSGKRLEDAEWVDPLQALPMPHLRDSVSSAQ